MSRLVDATTCVIIPNWNGCDSLRACLDSVQSQTIKPSIVVVDNGSTDGSVSLIEKNYPEVELIKHSLNKGFAGGVNPGFRRAIENKVDFVASLNNDAVAHPEWLKELTAVMDSNRQIGIATCKLLTSDGKEIDSTGDYYTNWGLPYPRGRGEKNTDMYDTQTEIFSASGGASLYRVKMIEEIGMFDEDFFAYYEDVDLSFRAQLAGWKVVYVPSAEAYHQIGATSSKIRGFTVYQTMKNLPLLLYKNIPRRYIFSVGWRFTIAHTFFFLRAVSRGQFWSALKGDAVGTWLLFTGYKKRRKIQHSKKVSNDYIWSMLIHDLPPNAYSLRRVRSVWWRLRRKKVT